jgi:spore coat polysaccharide biosynthesis protein SpsF
LPPDWRIAMVIGAAATADPQLDDLANQIGERLTLHRQVSDIASLMSEADLALAAFGMTAYELAAVGVPTLLLCLSEDHRRSALALAENNAAHIAGVAQEVGAAALDRTIVKACADAAWRDAMSRNARLLVDGRGAWRIAERLTTLAKKTDRAIATAR